MVLAMIGLVLDDSLTRLNALKQAISFSINIAAAVFFLFSGQVAWLAALVMAVGALAGGAAGGRLAGRIKPVTLRRIVVFIGLAVSVIYFVR
ncbi:MAG TPA: TSUP family transporter, partial [Nitrospirota bacterium]|nr:TSUP family transporter [Nitrospirota bacterium]